jgi:putative ABC transport system permease protein
LIPSLTKEGTILLGFQQRTKEIGIRKVLGASEFKIIQLLSTEFVLLVIIANMLAWPVAWYGANQWLSKFAYRIDVDMISFVKTIVVILLVTIATVGVQAMRAAISNPVDSLRNE